MVLALQDVAQPECGKRTWNLPGGKIRTDAEEVLVRGKNKRPDRRGDRTAAVDHAARWRRAHCGRCGHRSAMALPTVRRLSRINGNAGLAIAVEAAAREDLLKYDGRSEGLHRPGGTLPAGYELRKPGATSR